MSFCRQAPKIHQNCCTSPIRTASDHERNSWRQQWFGRRTDVHKIRNRWRECSDSWSLWNVWNRRWSWNQSTLSGSGFYWPSQLFVLRTCVQSQTEKRGRTGRVFQTERISEVQSLFFVVAVWGHYETHWYRSRERGCSRVSTLLPYFQLPLVFASTLHLT